jgi:hypothetical protein
MSAMLTFVIPVRHQDSVPDWGPVAQRLEATTRSIAAQTRDNWQCVIVANEGARLPALGAAFRVVRVDFNPPDLPREADDPDNFYRGVRTDKGRRILAGLIAARPTGYVMTVDYDDFVSRRLAELVGREAGTPGWYFDSGWLYDGTPFILRQPSGFSKICGTSHVVRADLLDLPQSSMLATPDYVERLGSHRFVESDLAARRQPLRRLPFAGAVYRIGHAGASSGSRSLLRTAFLNRNIVNPAHLLRQFRSVRPLSRSIRDEFFAGERP